MIRFAEAEAFNEKLRQANQRVCPLCRGCDQHREGCAAKFNWKDVRAVLGRAA